MVIIMPDVNNFSTVKEITEYVKPLTQQYRQYPSKKSEIVNKLEPIFGSSSDKWGLVIEYNKFVTSFHDSLGKKRRLALKKLLLELDYAHYKDVDFDVE